MQGRTSHACFASWVVALFLFSVLWLVLRPSTDVFYHRMFFAACPLAGTGNRGELCGALAAVGGAAATTPACGQRSSSSSLPAASR